MKSNNNISEKNKLNTIDSNINSRSQITTINTIENQKRNQKSTESSTKKISKKKLEEKFYKNKMIVALRSRPLLNRELEESNYNTITIPNRETVIITIPTEYISSDKGKYYFKGEKKIKVTKIKEAEFKYDFAFNDKTTQEEVYQLTTAPLVKQVINGFNATVFAYGATGTGKTFTMVGEGDNWGLMIRSISDLFKIINNEKEKKYIIKITYVEIYNEIIKDLLAEQNTKNKNTSLEIRTDAQKGVILQGAENKKVTNESETYKLIMRGNKHRTEKPSSFNENSSRSHAILQIYIEIEDQSLQTLNREKAFGKFVLVDLAGCEKTPILGKRNSESGSINKSLLALGKCIIALTSQNKGYIPWRDSKLTRLLQEPLIGNSRIVMIATVSPSIDSFDETMFTLQYAHKAKGVKITLKKNIVELDVPRINKFDEYIQNLRNEIEIINEQIGEKEKINANNISNIDLDQTNSNNVSFNNNNLSINKTNNENNSNFIYNDEYDKIQKEIVNHFQNEINLKKKIIEKENIIEDLKNELSQQEYELLHAAKVNQHYLKSKVETKRSEIEEKSKKMSKGYIKQNELIRKRKELQAIISKLSKTDPNNAQVKNLYNIYKYYLNLVNNINAEQKKVSTMNELKRKEKQITILTEQLDLRDLYIKNAYQELQINNIDFKYKNAKIISSDEIDLSPTRPPILKVSPSFKSLGELAKKMEMNNTNMLRKMPQSESKTNKNIENNQGKDSKFNSSFKSQRYKELLKRRQDLSELNEIKRQLVKDTKISKKRQFNNEVLNLFKYNPKISPTLNPNIGGLDMNIFERKKPNLKNFNFQSQTLVAAGERAMGNSSNKVNLIKKPTFQNYLAGERNNNYNFRYDGNGNLLRKNNSKKNYLNNLSFSKDYNSLSRSSSQIEITNTSPLENEVQKKVKTILKKDYIGRYKRSPYLRLLE